MPALSASQLLALRDQPARSKAYLAILAPQVNAVLYGVVVTYVQTLNQNTLTVTVTGGAISNILEGMTLWAGVANDDFSLGRIRVKSATTNAGINYIFLAEDSAIPFVAGTVVSVYQEFLPWVKLPFITPDGTLFKDLDIRFFTAPNQQTVLWPPVPLCGSAAVGVLVNGTAYVYFDGSASYTTAPGATFVTYAWVIRNPDHSVFGASAIATPGYIAFTVQGLYIVDFTVIDSNGISTMTHRQVLIVDPLNPIQPYYALTAFAVSKLTGDTDAGWELGVKVWGQSDLTYFPEGAQVLLYSDDYYGGTHNNGYQATSSTHGNTFADDSSIGSIVWANPNNALARDTIYSIVTLNAGQLSHYLLVSNFGFNLPSAAVVLGVQIGIVCHATGTVQDESVRLFVAGVVAGTNKAIVTNLSLVDTTLLYGGQTDLWGLALTATQVNASNFGIGFSAVAGSNGTVSIDYVYMTVYYYDDTGIGFEAHRTNVKYNGYILDDNPVTLDPQTSVIEFNTGSVSKVLSLQYMRPTFTQDKAIPTTWSESYALTVSRAALYLIYWHSTLMEICDVLWGADSTPVQIADFPKANFWDMLKNWVSSKRMGHAYVTKNGQVRLARDPMARTATERNAMAVVMQMQSSDWQGEVQISDNPLNNVAFADVSGVWYEGNPSANGIPIFSKAPGFTPASYGKDLAVQYLATTGQLDLNILTGSLYRWKNNDYPGVTVKMAGNWVSAMDTGYIEWVTAPSAGFPTNRGMLLANVRMIVRQMSVSVDNATGVWTTSVTFEPETPTTPSGVIGDYPPGVNDFQQNACPIGYVWDNTNRRCALLGATPSQFPWVNTFRDNVIVATQSNGVWLCDNFTSTTPLWSQLNTGLLQAGLLPTIDAMVQDPYNPSFLYMIGNYFDPFDTLFKFNPLTQLWSVLGTAKQIGIAAGLTNTGVLLANCDIRGLMVDPKKGPGWVGAFIINASNPNYDTWFVYSTDYGVTWAHGTNHIAASGGGGWTNETQFYGACGTMQLQVAQGGTQTIYCPLQTHNNLNNNGTLYYSTDGGNNWTASAYTSPTYNFLWGSFHIDPSDQSVLWNSERYILGQATGGIREFTGTASAVSVKIAATGSQRYFGGIDIFFNPSGHGQDIRLFDQNVQVDALHKKNMYHSSNEGAAFTTQVGAGLFDTGWPYGVMTIPDSNGKLIAFVTGLGNADPAAHSIYMSTDEGATWLGKNGKDPWTPDGNSLPAIDVPIISVCFIWNGL